VTYILEIGPTDIADNTRWRDRRSARTR